MGQDTGAVSSRHTATGRPATPLRKLGTTHTNAILETTSFNRPGATCCRSWRSRSTRSNVAYEGHKQRYRPGIAWASFLYDVIEQLSGRVGWNPPPEYDAVLIKALHVHSADWGSAGELYEAILKKPQNSRKFKEYTGQFLGYGAANIAKVMTCTDQRVTVLGFGELDDDEAHEFHLPLPPSLSAVPEKRRLDDHSGLAHTREQQEPEVPYRPPLV